MNLCGVEVNVNNKLLAKGWQRKKQKYNGDGTKHKNEIIFINRT